MSRWWPRGWRPADDLLVATSGTWDLGRGEHHPAFADWCRSHPGARCRVWVSSEHVVELVPDPALPIDTDAELLEWARAQLAAHGAADSASRPCAAWQAQALRGVSVIHGLELQRLQDDARAAGVNVLSIGPWWSCVLARSAPSLRGARSPSARLLVVEAARVAAIETRHGTLTGVCTAWLDEATPQALRDWTAQRGACHTVVYGHGLAGSLPGEWQAWPGLHAPTPFEAWLARRPA